jgi:hypothetical protein
MAYVSPSPLLPSPNPLIVKRYSLFARSEAIHVERITINGLFESLSTRASAESAEVSAEPPLTASPKFSSAEAPERMA